MTRITARGEAMGFTLKSYGDGVCGNGLREPVGAKDGKSPEKLCRLYVQMCIF